MKRKLMSMIGLEELKTTANNTESEVVIYAQITDFEGLKQATSKEEQEQYNIKSENSFTGAKGAVRVRKTVIGEVTTFDLTNKVKIQSDSMQKNVEEETTITENHFEAFKAICSEGMKKHRFKFNIEGFTLTDLNTQEKITAPGGVFEVDVFLKEDGTYEDWCKIDVEIDKVFEFLNVEHKEVKQFDLSLNISNLPFKPINHYTNDNATPEQKEHMSSLYRDVFTFKNK